MQLQLVHAEISSGSEIPKCVYIDDASFAVIEDWFASEEKLAILDKRQDSDMPYEVRFTAKFSKRCNDLLAKGGMEKLAERIFESYCLNDRFDQSTFESELSSLAELAAVNRRMR